VRSKVLDILTLTTPSNLDKNEDLLSCVSRKLLEADYVNDEYEKAILEREREYPTGLEITKELSVAIPHADPEYVKKEALVVIKPEKFIKFRKMDDPDVEIPVSIIFLLLIRDPDGYVKFLAKLTELFLKEGFIEIVRSGSLEDIKKFLKTNLQ
jgi:Phosphotransferase system mannitol/fructose-specific IIA domain (Ntr-type)